MLKIFLDLLFSVAKILLFFF